MKTKWIFLISMLVMVTGIFAQETIRIGIIGLDTSHSPSFVKAFNADKPKPEYAGFRVVAAYPYGSKTIKSSYDRIPKFTEEVQKFGVKIAVSIEELLKEVDCVMLETNDGNLHLEQAIQVFKAAKPVFIDKPIGANLSQAIAIFAMAEKYKVPVFSSSSLRFSTVNQQLRKGEHGKVFGVDAYSPGMIEPSHSDLSWYGIHGVESLFTVLGTGCVSVQRVYTPDADLVTGIWADGRIGTFRGIRGGKHVYGGSAITEKGAMPAGVYQGFDVLLVQVVQFFKTGISPVSKEETLEIFAFMDAADQSRRKGGKTILLKDVMSKANKEAEKLIRKIN